jgi:uncharacterized protein (TIGR02246 family)
MVTSTKFAFPVLLVALITSELRADEAAIRKAITAYAEAFNNKDLKAVSAMWAAQASHTDRETGERTEGREAIVADIAADFKENPKSRLSGRVDRIRLIKPDVASIEGQTTFATPDEEPTVSTFTAIVINEKGKWLIDSIDEMPEPQPPSPSVALKELEWLVGHWVDETPEVRVDTTIRWSPNRAFLLRSYVVQMADAEQQEGTQVIGWDPRSREIRSWSFNSDGSFGDGTWSRNGEDWLIKSSQTLVDGRAASGTYVLTQVDKDTVNLQLIGHDVEGEPQPAAPAVKMARMADAAPATSKPNTK